MTPKNIFNISNIIPVLTAHSIEDASQQAQRCLELNISIIEVTLRTPAALAIISALKEQFGSKLKVGAGTIISSDLMRQAEEAGAEFFISPGLTSTLMEQALILRKPFIPGISTVSDIMRGLEYGFTHFKFFPAEASGGLSFLSAIAPVLPNCYFCPTGGINPNNMLHYLELPNVSCVGGSWMFNLNHKE